VGQQVGGLRCATTTRFFCSTFADQDVAGTGDVQGQKAVLCKRFGSSGWECSRILNSFAAADDLYIDRMSQMRMDPQQGLWTGARVTSMAMRLPESHCWPGRGRRPAIAYRTSVSKPAACTWSK
jgi:hypothetical protein